MSPEQFHNKAVTGASDQYSLGIVAYEMLTGKKPFDGATYAEIITQHLFEPPPDLRTVRPDLPANVADAVMKMMAKEASARFPDLDAAVAALGTPTTTQGEKARTQIISIAKSGPDRKPRMSVPQSPVPAARKAPAPTVVEPAPAAKPVARPRPAAAPAEKKKSSSLAALIAAVLVIGGGAFGWYQFMGPGAIKPATDLAATQTGQPVVTPPAAPPAPDSTQIIAMRDSIAKVLQDSIARADSVTRVAEAAAAAAKARAANTRPANTQASGTRTPAPQTRTGATDTKISTQSAQTSSSPAADPPKPVVPPPAAEIEVRIGSRTPGATLYVNKVVHGVVASIGWLKLKPVNGQISLQIKADCSQAVWDTTLTIPPGSTERISIGYRGPQC
jgi:serine/threonine-protein kinase